MQINVEITEDENPLENEVVENGKYYENQNEQESDEYEPS